VSSVALLPSTWSAFSPVATPVAFVVNGAAALFVDSMRPTLLPPFVEKENAWPLARFDARMHEFVDVEPARQP
jgi:hypothetical protein